MAEKYRNGRPVHNETDDQNTRTTVIPPEARQQYRERYQQPQEQYYQQPYQAQQQSQPYPQQYTEQPQGRYYQQPYQAQPHGQPYPQQYTEQPQGQYYQQPYQAQPQGQPYPQQYTEQPQGQYYQQPYQAQPQGQPYSQQYTEQPQEQYYQQQYHSQPQRQARQQVKHKSNKKKHHDNQQINHQPQPIYSSEGPAVPSGRPAPPPGKQKKKKKHKRSFLWTFFKRIFYTLLILFLLIFGIYSCTAINLIKKLDYVPTGSRERTSGAITRSYVTSVLLIGTDGRTLDERGRSDTMMLVSVNSATNKVNVSSFMRDCYVEIPGYGWDKLNAAYSYGGPELLMDTIEHNFGVRIDDYVAINFLSFASIVDSVGGIDVDISDAEAQEINVILQAEVNEIMGDDTYADLLSGGGKNVHLVGKQALAYARIRHIGNADFERTERQRRVVDLVMNKLKSFNPVMLKNLSTKVLPDVTTNMDTAQLYFLSLRGPIMLGYDRAPMQIPAEGTYYGDSTPSGDALIVDFDTNYEMIKNSVFAKE